LIYAFYPLSDISGTRIRPGRKGYSSHSFESRIGTLCASIEDPIGTGCGRSGSCSSQRRALSPMIPRTAI
jgi:hypothetical protein